MKERLYFGIPVCKRCKRGLRHHPEECPLSPENKRQRREAFERSIDQAAALTQSTGGAKP